MLEVRFERFSALAHFAGFVFSRGSVTRDCGTSSAPRLAAMQRPSPPHESRHLWGVVLTGSLEGHRARRPALLGERPALVRQALERAARLIPPERLVAVLTRGHGVPD